ncbi:hyaluronidase-5-like [Antedon mediterranea]|uniref:hyaluronidase-5-like n=1 Tax=Antedon mediterranea TaxID=105859 RepID=UPI003AF6963B
MGDVFNAFHSGNFGYPYIDDDTRKFINGGLPQARNLRKHLEIATVEIIKKIPNSQFNGLAIIDWEKWKPHLDENFDKRTIYKNASVDLVKQRIPNLNNTSVYELAKVEYEMAAESLMKGVLRLGKTLRPNASWGFYHYPYCHNKEPSTDYECLNATVASNDKMTWLFDESSAIFPSIYLLPYVKNNLEFVNSKLQEALRVVNNLKEPGKPVYVYNRFNYSNSGLYYNIGDIEMSVCKAAILSFDGIVLWGSKEALENTQSCTELKQLLATVYGPALLNTKTQAESCGNKMCSGHGRCLLDDARFVSDALWDWRRLDFVKCRCLTGWTGNNCSKKP